MIKIATSTDYKSIYEIYKPYVELTAVSFELSVPKLTKFSERIKKTQYLYPWLVAETNKGIVGYAYASAHRQREAYQWTAEVSVYVDKAYHRKHIASSLTQP